VILSDRSISEAIASGRLGIDPFDPRLVQPSSIDVRLDNKFLVFRNTKRAFIDVKQPADDLMEMIEVGQDEPMFLHPHEFVLGSTIERVRMPDDLVARLEGRSSLGRLGVVIHSSLPYDSPVLFREEDGMLDSRQIGEIVERRLRGQVVGFDKDTFEVGLHEVTNWLTELPDRIYEVKLASGRHVHVTAGHNLFTVSASGELRKTPTRQLRPGTQVAIPKSIPELTDTPPEYRLLEVLSPEIQQNVLCSGPTVDVLLDSEVYGAEVRRLLRGAGRSVAYYVRTRKLPLGVVTMLHGTPPDLTCDDRLRHRADCESFPAVLRIEPEVAWLLGLYLAEGYRRAGQIVVANTNQSILDRAQAAFASLGQRVYRGNGAMMCGAILASAVFDGLAMGTSAPKKRLPRGALHWPRRLIEALLDGLLDGDGPSRPEPDCLRTTSAGLVQDVLYACARLGRRAVAECRHARIGCLPVHVVSIAANGHGVLTSVPDPFEVPVDVRNELGLWQVQAAEVRGFMHATSLAKTASNRDKSPLHVAALEPVRDSYARVGPSVFNAIGRLTRLVNGGLQWDKVVEVVDTGRFEVVYDLEVRSSEANVENFLAGYGGVFVSNTAGFIDPAFDGHVTLEISNLANLPIALYPGMRIGQLSFSVMTTPAERPYGPARGSKYSGQDVPTASRLYLDFLQLQQQQP
jgi:dCTP deaminase